MTQLGTHGAGFKACSLSPDVCVYPPQHTPARKKERRNSEKREFTMCLVAREVFLERRDFCWALKGREALEKEEGRSASQTRLTWPGIVKPGKVFVQSLVTFFTGWVRSKPTDILSYKYCMQDINSWRSGGNGQREAVSPLAEVLWEEKSRIWNKSWLFND